MAVNRRPAPGRGLLRGAAALLLLAAGACETGHAIRPRPVGAAGFAPWTDTPVAYRVHPGDQIEVRFPYVPEFNLETTVPPDGRLPLPLAGTIDANDATLGDLSQAIEDAYRPIMKRPDAAVLLKSSPGWKVYVGGQVEHPGAVPLSGWTGPLEAVIQAGGFRNEARLDQVVLIRRGPDKRPMLRIVDAKAMIERADARNDVPLEPGDILFVPRSSVAEFDLWIEQFVTRAMPFNREFSYTLNRNL